jgi:hypothetical protein
MIKIAKMATVPLNRIKTINGNREVSESHKEQFKRLIQKRGFGGSLNVGVKNQDYYILEGQHRLRALFELGVREVPCSIIDWIDVDNFDEVQPFIIDMNAHNKKWQLEDYIKSFADKSLKEYVYLRKQIQKYSNTLSPGVVVTIYDGVKRGHKQLKKGNLIYINKEFSDFLIETLSKMVDQWSKKKLPAQTLRQATYMILNSDDPYGYTRAFKLATTTQLTTGKEPMPDGDDTFAHWFENTVEETYLIIKNIK